MALLIASVLLATLSGAWVIAPILMRRFALIGDVVPGSMLDAQAKRRVALASLKELEYDYVAGKLDEADYHTMREQLSLEALQAMRGAQVQPTTGLAGIAGTPHGCGFANAAGSRFCGGCGAALG
jgi:hypothetical protein